MPGKKSGKTIYVVNDVDRMQARKTLENVIGHVGIIEAVDGQHLLQLLANRTYPTEPFLTMLDIHMLR